MKKKTSGFPLGILKLSGLHLPHRLIKYELLTLMKSCTVYGLSSSAPVLISLKEAIVGRLFKDTPK
jgi:hypothetical protein